MKTRMTLSWVCILLVGCASKPSSPQVKSSEAGTVTLFKSDDQPLSIGVERVIKVEAQPSVGFNFDYYLFLPAGVKAKPNSILFVEPNNTGRTTDDLTVHDEAAKMKTQRGYFLRIAKRFESPMLVPVFPRAPNKWGAYTHYFDRRTLAIEDGPLKRIDLQLISMIDHARSLLAKNGVRLAPKIFLNGFSSSAAFSLRFTALHPTLVQAVSAGGINALPILPLTSWQREKLRYPVGVGDLKELTGSEADLGALLKVPQKLYMGELDTNDTVPFRDAWTEQEAKFIKRLFGERMMPDRWLKMQSILKEAGANVDLKTYPGVGHSVPADVEEEIVQFFLTQASGSR